jgi:hypothetical protein
MMYGSIQDCKGCDMINSKKRLFYLRNRNNDFILEKTAKSYLELEQNITRFWAMKGITWQN